jgi:hypothetical protein
MIDYAKDDLITLDVAAGLLPKVRDTPVHKSTMWRWASRGVKGVRLETIKVGGKTYTTKAALDEFMHDLNSK